MLGVWNPAFAESTTWSNKVAYTINGRAVTTYDVAVYYRYQPLQRKVLGDNHMMMNGRDSNTELKATDHLDFHSGRQLIIAKAKQSHITEISLANIEARISKFHQWLQRFHQQTLDHWLVAEKIERQQLFDLVKEDLIIEKFVNLKFKNTVHASENFKKWLQKERTSAVIIHL